MKDKVITTMKPVLNSLKFICGSQPPGSIRTLYVKGRGSMLFIEGVTLPKVEQP